MLCEIFSGVLSEHFAVNSAVSSVWRPARSPHEPPESSRRNAIRTGEHSPRRESAKSTGFPKRFVKFENPVLPWARRNDESDGVTSWKSGALWEGRLYIRIRLCAQSDGGTLIDSDSPTDHAERLVRPRGHLSVQRSFSPRSGDVSEPARRMDTKPTRAKQGPKVSPCGADEAQPNKHSGRRTRTTPK